MTDQLIDSIVSGNYETFEDVLILYINDSSVINGFVGHMTPLMTACQYGPVNFVNALLESPVINVNESCSEESTAIHVACSHGNIDIVNRLLIVPNIDYNADDIFGTTPLMAACYRNRIEVVKRLLEIFDINYNTVDYSDGYSAFMIACKGGHTEIVKELLKCRGIVYDNICCNNKTPLILACEYSESVETVKLLLKLRYTYIDAFCTGNVNDDVNFTALMGACKHGQVDIIKELLKHRCNIYMKTAIGRTALSISQYYLDNLDSDNLDKINMYKSIITLLKEYMIKDIIKNKSLGPLSHDIVHKIIMEMI
jgi:ankyrin repeat protein